MCAHASSKFFPSPAPAMQAISAMPPPTVLLLSCIATSHILRLQNSPVPCYVFTDETVHLDYETLLRSNNIHLAPGGGVLPYITYTGICRAMGLWFWSSWFRTGYPFQRRFLERGIIFRTHESSSFVRSHLKLFKDRLLLKIRFNALTSKLLCSCCTLERSIKNWPISRTGYQF